MTREQFLLGLRKKLKRLPKSEIENIISYYNDYFEDSEKSDEEVIKELGSVSSIASQILADYAFDDKKQSRGMGHKIVLIILAIFAAPVGLPLAAAAVAILFSIVVVIGSVLLALAISVFAFFVAGVAVCIGGIAVIFQGPATSVFYIGAGFIILGLCILLVCAIKNLVPKAYLYVQHVAASLLAKFNRRNKKGE